MRIRKYIGKKRVEGVTPTEYEIGELVGGRIRRYPEITQVLYTQGALLGFPVQVKRLDLTYDEGVDIVYKLRDMTPARFRQFSELLLEAALVECNRYEEERYYFAKFEVQLNRTTKGRKMVSPRRTYIAAKHDDPEVMVFGEKALGYTLPEEYKKRPFLVNKVEEILDIPDSPSPGPYVNRQRPYKVLSMTICVRAGLYMRPDLQGKE